ncbi:MAG: trigger factor [Hydrogenophilales bacterium CG17_big_fil_post_rev_8_21_14_2_50_63_12]|nr:MAG: trigger factor [Hydrogenophilales bacterium CG17_big_fil_post_rev_8_21_14_2_50_63_12]PIX96298.1 MAG: trigger factor [Hydrogenophilales bacterium CG_4_10_14_3_um_filter_63_21]PJB04477.1 MAG: trigger factor [Hydrogenophilales bacterium CG_4_9_14_3_um_filter_63_34]
MTATLETLDGLSRRMTLNLNPAEIEAEVSKRLGKIAKNARMDGFRPGKAPLKLVAARYSGEIRGEVLGDALQQRFTQAALDHNLHVAGYPQFAPAPDGAFTATFDVFPEIKVGDLSGIKVTRPIVEVSDADVDRTLDILRKQRVHYHAVERAAAVGDRVHIDYTGTIGGEPFQGGEARDFPVILGEGRTLKDFEGSLVDMKAGETKTFDVTFPEDYFAKELAGKTATFTATLNAVHEAHLPDIDDALALGLGIHEGGVAQLKQEIRANLAREAKRRIQARVKEQVFNGLLEATPFEVPAGLVAMERRALLEKAVTDLKARGMREQDIQMRDEIFEPQARRRVALGLLMDELVRANGITAASEQVQALVDEFAQSYEDPSEVVDWYQHDASRLNEARALVLEENIVNWVLERAQISDEPTTLEKLMGNK